MSFPLPFQRIGDHDLPLPAYATEGDAGLDLRSTETIHLQPGERTLVPNGFAVAIPEGHVGLVHPRSGLAAKSGITVLNAPGTVDSGYRGELKTILINLSDTAFTINPGDRIAQMVIQAYITADPTEATELPASERGAGGFGHTGVA